MNSQNGNYDKNAVNFRVTHHLCGEKSNDAEKTSFPNIDPAFQKAMKQFLLLSFLTISGAAIAQERLTPEKLWGLSRVSAEGLSPSGKTLYYSVKNTDWKTEKSNTRHYRMNFATGANTETTTAEGFTVVQRDGDVWWATKEDKLYRSGNHGDIWNPAFEGLEGAGDMRVSPDGRYIAFVREVLVKPVLGTDLYPDLPKTTAKVYRDLNDRHWDEWEDGKYNHIFIAPMKAGGKAIDIMPGEPYDAPQKPFGGSEDFVWSPDSKGLVYVCKKKFGTQYATSTNTDLYYYNISSHETVNWTAGMMGYDTNPSFSPDGHRIAWLSMRRDGYESDKNDIVVMDVTTRGMLKRNLTADWDGVASTFSWSQGSDRI